MDSPRRATADAKRKKAANPALKIVAAMERYKGGHTEKAVSEGKASYYTGSVMVKIRK
jgi:hypothetical protein